MLTATQVPCVLHNGWTVGSGYAGVTRDGKTRIASRVVWEDAHGPIPEGYEIHHSCENKLCLNVAHLVLISRREHRLLHVQHKRAAAKRGAQMRNATQCSQGHKFTAENTYYTPSGHRSCRKCRAEAARHFRVKEVVR